MKFSKYLINEKFLTGDKTRVRFGRKDDPIAYINVHVNPDHSEVLSIIDDFKQTSSSVYRSADVKDFVRGFFDKEGNLYVWYGAFFHDNVERFLRGQPGTSNLSKNEDFRFSWIKGNDYLTLESVRGAAYFINKDNFKDEETRVDLLKRLYTAFPMTKADRDGEPSVSTDAGDEAWVPDIRGVDGETNSTAGGKGKSVQDRNGYKIKDEVEIANSSHENKFIKKGMKGIIVDITLSYNMPVAVQFMDEVQGCHDCQGAGKKKQCWWFNFEDIRKVKEKSVSKVKTPEKASDNDPKNVDVKKLAKMGDTIVFKDGTTPAKYGKEVKILAIATSSSGRYHYIYKSRKDEQDTYSADKFYEDKHKITFIDGKFNIKKANEPFSVIVAPESLVRATSSYIEKIIPDPERLKRLGNNLYEPRNVVSRGYTNPDRMEVRENIK